MAITLVQEKSAGTGGVGAPLAIAFTSNVTAGSLLVACAHASGSTTITGVSDNVNGAWTSDLLITPNVNVDNRGQIFSFPNAGAGATTVTLTLASGLTCTLQIFEFAGAATASHVGATAQAVVNGSTPTVNITTTFANSLIVGTTYIYDTAWVLTAGTNFTMGTQRTDSGVCSAAEYWLDAGATGSKAVAYGASGGAGGEYSAIGAVEYKLATTTSTLFKGVIGGGLGGKKMVIG